MVLLVGCQSNDADETRDTSSGSNVSGDPQDSDSHSPAPVCPVPTELRTANVMDLVKDSNSICAPDRLNWDPQSQKSSNCQLVLEYAIDQADYDSPPACPTDNGEQWEESNGDVLEKTERIDGENQTFRVRHCIVRQLPAPINCNDVQEDEYGADDATVFGWYYCENPGEDNMLACTDGLDNDRDAAIDSDDPDCQSCAADQGCADGCPYEITLTPSARTAALEAKSTQIICLVQYHFEDANCN